MDTGTLCIGCVVEGKERTLEVASPGAEVMMTWGVPHPRTQRKFIFRAMNVWQKEQRLVQGSRLLWRLTRGNGPHMLTHFTSSRMGGGVAGVADKQQKIHWPLFMPDMVGAWEYCKPCNNFHWPEQKRDFSQRRNLFPSWPEPLLAKRAKVIATTRWSQQRTWVELGQVPCISWL